MAAKIVLPSKADWVVIERFLQACKQGAIVIDPSTQDAMAVGGFDVAAHPSAGDVIDYNYGGEPDTMIDVVRSVDHVAVHEMLKQMSVLGAWSCPECNDFNLPNQTSCTSCGHEKDTRGEEETPEEAQDESEEASSGDREGTD